MVFGVVDQLDLVEVVAKPKDADLSVFDSARKCPGRSGDLISRLNTVHGEVYRAAQALR